jgi:hypothetical protein
MSKEQIVFQTGLPDEAQSHPPQDLEAAARESQKFLDENAPNLGALFGLRHISITFGDGWATNLETGEVTADPKFFIERGYTPEMSAYAISHEVAAHLREVQFAPELTRETIAFLGDKDPQLRQAKSILHNILSDIAGNNLIHSVLPTMEDVAAALYGEKLFPEDDYTATPKHLQFLYKVMRSEMIPGSTTAVSEEVDELIDSLRDYNGSGDIIAYSTQVAKSRRVAMPNHEKFDIWTKVIYPEWIKLYHQDEQDPQFQQGRSDAGDEGSASGTDAKSSPSEGGEAGSETKSKPDFTEFYDDYFESKHPEPLDHEEIDKLKEASERIGQEQSDPSTILEKQIREETGHGLAEKRIYDAEVLKWQSEIAELRKIFASIINERVGQKRQLRGSHIDGALLNPDTLVQTYIDVTTGHLEPPAFSDYEKTDAERHLTGKTDYVFVFDRSGSMSGANSESAASSVVICLEALAGMQRDIADAERENNTKTDLEINTALYTFNHEIDQPKQLSGGLSPKERLDCYSLVNNPDGGNADSHALAEVEKMKKKPSHKQILIVVSDGLADDPTASRASVERLRKDGWQVYGVSIGSDAAVELYKPDSQRIDDPTQLPKMIKTLLERTIG